MIRALLALLATVAVPAASKAQTTPAQSPPPAAQARPDCSAPEHHQFDFWLGTWNVTVAGKPAGTNRIESVMSGCGIERQDGVGERTAGIDVQRIRWSKNADGTVRQVWESSTDGAKTWTVAFDGIYAARP